MHTGRVSGWHASSAGETATRFCSPPGAHPSPAHPRPCWLQGALLPPGGEAWCSPESDWERPVDWGALGEGLCIPGSQTPGEGLSSASGTGRHPILSLGWTGMVPRLAHDGARWDETIHIVMGGTPKARDCWPLWSHGRQVAELGLPPSGEPMSPSGTPALVGIRREEHPPWGGCRVHPRLP